MAFLGRDGSSTIRSTCLDHGDGDLGKLVIEVFFPVHLYIFDKRAVRGNLVDARAFLARIHKQIQAHFGERTRKSARLCPNGVGDASQRQVIGFKTVFQNDLLRAEHRPEVTADQTVHSALANIPLRVAVLIPDTESGAGNDGQMFRGVRVLIASVQRFMELNRALNSDKGIDTDTVAVPYKTDGLIC